MSEATEEPILQTLQSAVDGLLFPSETDAPLVPFFWSDGQGSTPQSPLTSARLREVADLPTSAKIKTVPLETFFRPATEEKEWHNDDERAEARRFQELVEVIQSTLDKPKVFRVGETNIDVYIVGAVEGGYAGLKTNVVET